ncbi:PIN domain-containing protein [Clostridiaceae bacterium 14S0207]|nr:PIN domain-containing protein [Clostridiaceae bacterium 14S0207]
MYYEGLFMDIIEYPFSECNFNAGSSIMMDTCFILTLLYDKDPKNRECCNIATKLKLLDCNLYITDMVAAETINQITKKLFLNDMKYRLEKVQPVNTISDINLIIACFNKHHRKIIREKKLEKYKEIPFNKYFYNICKNEWKKDLLKVYFDKSVELHTYLENILNFEYLSINKDCINIAKTFMNEYMLSVNDAFHLACSQYYGIQYFLTLDRDFQSNIQTTVKLLKI